MHQCSTRRLLGRRHVLGRYVLGFSPGRMVNVTDHSSPQESVTMLPVSGTTNQSSKTLSSAASGLLGGTNTTLPLAEPNDNLYKVNINSRTMRDHFRTLVDRGANGGVVGDDMRIVSTTDRSINTQGLQKHTLNDLTLVTAGGVTRTQMGEVIIILPTRWHPCQDRRPSSLPCSSSTSNVPSWTKHRRPTEVDHLG